MTTKLPISFACTGYDRMDALRTGEVEPEGVDLSFLTVNHPRDVFDCMMGGHDFDAGFRHGFIAVDERQVRCAKDLEGKKVGVQVYTMTSAVWIRGLLAQEGLDLESIEWMEGAMEKAGSHAKSAALKPLKPVKITSDEDHERSLSQSLADGEIAATIGTDLPTTFGSPSAPHFKRLFPDYRVAEQAYYLTHGIFPIMHPVVLKRSLAEKYPWLPSSLYTAFEASRQLALRRMKLTGALRYILPWLPSASDGIEEVFEGGSVAVWSGGKPEDVGDVGGVFWRRRG